MLTNRMIIFNCNNKLYATVKVFTYVIEEPNRLLLIIMHSIYKNRNTIFLKHMCS